MICIRNQVVGAVGAQALDEIHAGIFDGMSYEEIEVQQPEEFRARKSDKLRYRCGAHRA